MGDRRGRGRMLGVATAALALVVPFGGAPAHAAPRPVPAAFFGMHDTRLATGGFPSVPTGSVRLWDVGCTWRDVQPARTKWAFGCLDRAVANARSHRSRALVVLGLTPAWAAADRRAPGVYGPGTSSPPKSLALWRAYVTKVVQRYRGTVDYQVWNEPNIPAFWSGSPAQMVRLEEETARIVGRYAPRATLVGPSLATRRGSQLVWLRRYAAAGGGRTVDAIGLHLYPAPTAGPEASIALLGQARRMLAARGISKPVWCTELNYGASFGPAGSPPVGYSAARASAYVARAFVLAAQNGVARVFWYGWDTPGTSGIAMSRGGVPTRAATAYARVRSWLLGSRMDGCSVDRSGTYTCRMLLKDRSPARVMWNPERAVRVRTPSSTRTTTPLSGTVTRESGARTLRVGGTPVLIRTAR
ncbi:glycosyl hydrolase [Motilibacter deserti]|uniref:Asl1-like glycosyl hydrolase catalytic domain-containing protein n=1 Tax=Motilibacter deserti TaxID=2714956 RepID=A0ABX0GW08_9ACTN|nr:glycosyl hydrolase [Motilibacter deserti]NHC14740.1 hypothetical protein [Motilibacter deserti]